MTAAPMPIKRRSVKLAYPVRDPGQTTRSLGEAPIGNRRAIFRIIGSWHGRRRMGQGAYSGQGVSVSLTETATPAAGRVVGASGPSPFGGFQFGDGIDELAAEPLLQGEASRGALGAGAEILPRWQAWRLSIRRANSQEMLV